MLGTDHSGQPKVQASLGEAEVCRLEKKIIPQLLHRRWKIRRDFSRRYLWLLSNGVDHKLVHRKPTTFLKESHHLGIKGAERVQEEKRSFVSQSFLQKK